MTEAAKPQAEAPICFGDNDRNRYNILRVNAGHLFDLVIQV